MVTVTIGAPRGAPMTVASFPIERPTGFGASRRPRSAVVVIVVTICAAMLALYGLRPVATETRADGFPTTWRATVSSYALETSRIQDKVAASSSLGEAGLLEIYGDLAAMTDRQVAAFAELEPPSAAAVPYEAFVTLLRKQAATLDQLVRAARVKDTAALAVAVRTLSEVLVDLVESRTAVDAALGGTRS